MGVDGGGGDGAMLGAGRRKRSCKHNIVVLVFFLWFVF